MKGICYDEHLGYPRKPFTGNVWAMDATKHFITHFENSLLLSFILANSDNTIEKCQASKELGIADKKMEFWKRHRNFSQEKAEKEMMEAKRKWR